MLGWRKAGTRGSETGSCTILAAGSLSNYAARSIHATISVFAVGPDVLLGANVLDDAELEVGGWEEDLVCVFNEMG